MSTDEAQVCGRSGCLHWYQWLVSELREMGLLLLSNRAAPKRYLGTKKSCVLAPKILALVTVSIIIRVQD